MGRNQTKRRQILHETSGGKCHWCGKSTRLCGSQPNGDLPLDASTVDHVYARGTSMRKQAGGSRTVNACHECNQRRSRENCDEIEAIKSGIAIVDPMSVSPAYYPFSQIPGYPDFVNLVSKYDPVETDE